jgi:hypothetical protein
MDKKHLLSDIHGYDLISLNKGWIRKSIAENLALAFCAIDASLRADRFLALLEAWLPFGCLRYLLIWRSIEPPTVSEPVLSTSIVLSAVMMYIVVKFAKVLLHP